jgi:polar amino acid transport system substrate-binding protein
MRSLPTLLLVALALLVAGCGGDDDSGGSASTGAASTAAATQAAARCDNAQLQLQRAGTLTIGTDKPAFPPYFEDDDPTNGRGFESAVAYAVARELGFSREEVRWTTVPFNSSFAPGSKRFDFDINRSRSPRSARAGSTSPSRTSRRRRP